MTEPATVHRAGQFGILLVCTGNTCRSAFAEILARRLLVERLGVAQAARFRLSSAGTHALPGVPIDPLSRVELAPWGLDGAAAENFTSRPLTVRTVGTADLVLTAERAHRSHVVQAEPAALGSTFCLREFARLVSVVDRSGLPADPVGRAHAAVAAARANRGLLPPVPPGQDDVADPKGRDQAAHHVSASTISCALHHIIDTLWGPGPRR